MICHGNSEDHCCWLSGEVCQFLEEGTVPGRRWACKLRRELGSWDAVHRNAQYLVYIKPKLEAASISVDCGDWPQKANTHCTICGYGVSDG